MPKQLKFRDIALLIDEPHLFNQVQSYFIHTLKFCWKGMENNRNYQRRVPDGLTYIWFPSEGVIDLMESQFSDKLTKSGRRLIKFTSELLYELRTYADTERDINFFIQTLNKMLEKKESSEVYRVVPKTVNQLREEHGFPMIDSENFDFSLSVKDMADAMKYSLSEQIKRLQEKHESALFAVNHHPTRFKGLGVFDAVDESAKIDLSFVMENNPKYIDVSFRVEEEPKRIDLAVSFDEVGDKITIPDNKRREGSITAFGDIETMLLIAK